MLDIKRDRLNYWDLLRPEESYEIDKVLVTSYSLDMETLIGLSILLGLKSEYNEDVFSNKIYMLKALETMSNKTAIICQKGRIKVPKEENKLYTILEKCIYTINLKEGNFHPKVWLVRYKNDKNIKYKMVVSSKNLTYDRSWDTQICMRGEQTKEKQGNESIKAFLEFLERNIEQNTNTKNLRIIQQIKDEIEYIKFDTTYNNFQIRKCEFIQYGETKNKIEYLEKKCNKKIKQALIISPFITKTPINNLKNNLEQHGKIYLITRKKELTNELVNEVDTYIVNNAFYDGEDIIEDEQNERKKQDIHSKIFIFDNGKNIDFYIGSANATYSAFNRNTEVMIHLEISSKYDIINTIKKELIENEDNYFVKASENDIVENEEIQEQEKTLRDLQKEILNLKTEAKADKRREKYNINICFENYSKINLQGYKIKIKPLLNMKISKEMNENINFSNFSIEELSELYILEFEKNKIKDEMVIKISTQNLPSIEERVKTVCKDIIKNKEDFLEYLNAILDDNFSNVLLETNTKQSKKNGINNFEYMPGIYEKMLKELSNNSKKIKEIEEAIDFTNGDKEKIPENFYNLYIEFKKVVDRFAK